MNALDQPVSIGDVLDVEIETQGSEGDGMAFVDGLAVIVPEARPDDQVTIRIEDVTTNCAFAEVWER